MKYSNYLHLYQIFFYFKKLHFWEHMGGYEIFLNHGVVDVLIFNPVVDDIIELSEGLVVWHNVSVHAPKMIV